MFLSPPPAILCVEIHVNTGTVKAATSWLCMDIFMLQFSESPEVQARSAFSTTAEIQTNPFMRTVTAAVCGRA